MFGLLHTNIASYPGSFTRKEEMSPWTRLTQTSHHACMGFCPDQMCCTLHRTLHKEFGLGTRYVYWPTSFNCAFSSFSF